MRNKFLFAAACAALAAPLAFAQNPFEGFKGKMKEGLYEMKTEMDMSGMKGVPAGMSKMSNTFQHCVTAQDIEKGEVGKGRPDGKMPQDCEVKDMKMSGNTATYKMVCKGQMQMTSDNTMTFTSDGYKMDMKMTMNQQGQVMNMNNKIESKYLGPCKK
jgi:hypothetical protein